MIPEHPARLRGALAWALSRERPASERTRAAVAESKGSYRLEDVDAARDRIEAAIEENLGAWLEDMCEEAGHPAQLAELDLPAERMWRMLLRLNEGIFSTEAAHVLPLLFMVTVPSRIPGRGPLYLSPNFDGWGVKPAGRLAEEIETGPAVP